MSGVRIDVTAPVGHAEKGIKSVHGLLTGLGTEAKKSLLTGVGLAGGVAAFSLVSGAIKGAIGFMGDAIRAASNLAESQGKVNVVFGDSAKEITDWASTASKAFGQSKQQALEAAGTYGNLFQAFGVGQQEATKMSKTLVELAADLASFNNTSVDDALVALRSGLSGETEPLKRYGIAISDARMRTELARQGFKDLGATLTPLQKSTAAYALIMKDSSLAQGDFARTSDGLANVQRTLEAQLADLTAEIGQELMPVMLQLAKVARDDLVPALRDVMQFVKDAKPVWDILGQAIDQQTGGPLRRWGEGLRGAGQEATVASRVIEAESGRWAGLAAAELAAGKPEVAAAANVALTVPLTEAMREAGNKAIAAARALPGQIAAALRDGRADWKAALAQIGTDLEAEMTRAARIAELQAALIGTELVAGLRSTDPLVLAQAQFTRNLIMQQLKIEGAQGWGWNIGSEWGQGMLDSLNYYVPKVRHALNAYRGFLEGHSPPREGPLKDIDKGGFNIGKAWADSFGLGMSGFKVPSLPSGLGLSGGGGASGSVAGMGRVGGSAQEIHIHIDQGAYIDGPSIDLLAAKITQRLRFAPGT